MAMASLSPLYLNSSVLPSSSLYPLQSRAFHRPQSSSSWFCFQTRTRTRTRIRTRTRSKPICLSITKKEASVRKEDIIIVGAGIAGLATAVSLYRLGVRSLVLEQSDSLRTGGTSLGLFKNGWRVLDVIGVGSDLRSQFLEIQGMTVKSEDGRELRSFRFKDEDASQEVRTVERGILLETLANQLPPESVQFSSKLSKIETSGDGEPILELVDGTRLSANIVIGCDGIRSPVAKWMGFPEPKYVGHVAYRGIGYYPNGQPFEPKVNYIYGRGVRAGYVPVSSTKVYWFICFNNPSPGPRITDPVELKKQAKDLVKNWPTELLNNIDVTPDDTVIRTPLVDRWLWPAASPPAYRGSRVVLVGDAWHPMTPNLGQGACCALEDAVVLARKLAKATKYGTGTGTAAFVEEALRSYESERWPRIFPMTVRSNLVGSFLQWENPVVCSVRNNVVVPKLLRLGPMLEHTNFDCQPLIMQGVKA